MRAARAVGLTSTLAVCTGLAVAALTAQAGPPEKTAWAKSLPKHTKQALLAAKRGDGSAAVRALETALTEVRRAAPLEVRQAVVTSVRHAGLGLYEPVAGGKVTGREVMLYVEVANFEQQPIGDGRLQSWLEVVATFAYEDGTALGDKELGTHRFQTRTEMGVTSFGLDVGLSQKAPPGRYDLVLRVADKLSGKVGTRPVSFVLP